MTGFSATSSRWRLASIALIAVLGLLVAGGSVWGLTQLTGAQTGPGATTTLAPVQDAAGPQWTGTVYAGESRESEWVTAGYTMRGDFWFRAHEEGDITGHAIVTYEPSYDVGRMDGAVNYVKDVGDAAMGILTGGPALALATSVKDQSLATYTGLAAEPDQQNLIRSGPITGTLQGDSISLQWQQEQPSEIPVEVSMQFIKEDKHVTDTAIRIAHPWAHAATVQESGSGLVAESHIRPDPTTEDGVTTTTTHTWVAYQIGG